MAPHQRLPPIRATIFDMDGLILDSEDAYTRVTNQILRENGRPDLPWKIKAQLQGRPGPAAGRIFQEWAQLPIPTEEFMARQKELQAVEFTKCKPLPGVKTLLERLNAAKTMTDFEHDWERRVRSPGAPKPSVHMAVATSSHAGNFEIKTKNWKSLFEVFPPRQVIVGDDVRVPKGRGKPLPDIYLLALQVINDELEDGQTPIKPEECLVFEDSVPGVEAGRRAGMRVVWCPHPGLLEVYKDRVEEVLAGRTGEHKDSDLDHSAGVPLPGSPGKVGELRDGWAELLSTLEEFDYLKYGIDISDERYRSESGQPAQNGTTDKELEEMCARADGKAHSQQEGSRYASPVPGLAETNPKV